MTPAYVSFFTPAYAAEASGLVETLDAFNLPHDVRAVPDAGSWVRNCSHKPAFLLEMRAAHPGRPLVWLDADARVKSRPVLFDTLDYDFAAHWRHGVELLSGTLYFGATDGADALLSRWRRECEAFPGEWDQRRLQVAVGLVPWLRVYGLPAPYTAVFDDPKMGPPVIEHRQASRRLACK